jgi:hypothetical protein
MSNTSLNPTTYATITAWQRQDIDNTSVTSNACAAVLFHSVPQKSAAA